MLGIMYNMLPLLSFGIGEYDSCCKNERSVVHGDVPMLNYQRTIYTSIHNPIIYVLNPLLMLFVPMYKWTFMLSLGYAVALLQVCYAPDTLAHLHSDGHKTMQMSKGHVYLSTDRRSFRAVACTAWPM